ncbi:hypothetical protein H0W32_02325 [Patescibacteria group bacterium]|nr:hypothetical protein [Patescibacteria group bacterium]
MDYIQIYADFLKKSVALSKPLKVVCDSSNGSAGVVIKKLKDMIPDMEIISIHDDPDPDFKAHGPNPLNAGATDDASKKVLETGADFGAIFDADGDRAFFVDNEGVMLPSFMTATLLFKNNEAPYVADETVFKSLEHLKVTDSKLLVPSKVGSFYVKQVLKETHASVGAEFSGHYYFKDFFGADSGIFTMIQIANIVSKLPSHLAEYRKSLPPQDLVNEEMKLGDKTWKDMEPKIMEFAKHKGGIIETREGITLDIGTLWINMRPSNTEPIIRFIGGGRSSAEIMTVMEEIKKLV